MKTEFFFNTDSLLEDKIKSELFLPLRDKFMNWLMVTYLILSLIYVYVYIYVYHFQFTRNFSLSIILSAVLFLLLFLFIISYPQNKKWHKKGQLRIQQEFEKEKEEAFKKFYKSGDFGKWMAYYSEVERRSWDDEKIENFLLSIPYMKMIPVEMWYLIEEIKEEYSRDHMEILHELEKKYIG